MMYCLYMENLLIPTWYHFMSNEKLCGKRLMVNHIGMQDGCQYGGTDRVLGVFLKCILAEKLATCLESPCQGELKTF